MTNQAKNFTTRLRAAFTLVEMLIAMALTLILVYSIAEFYAYIGTAVRDGRATIEMGGQLRAVSQQLNDDLQSLTLRPKPWVDPYVSPGYFSIYEGPGYDADPDFNTIATNSLFEDSDTNKVTDLVEGSNVTTLFGDGDDIIAGTIRAKDTPFQGRQTTTTGSGSMAVTNTFVINSPYAEVLWYTAFVDSNGDSNWNIGETRFLCRKLLLIRPDLDFSTKHYNSIEEAFDFWEGNDISVRIEARSNMSSTYYIAVANSLAELSLRRNRFGCNLVSNGPRNDSTNPTLNATAPYHIDINPNNAGTMSMYTLQGDGVGEDRVLTNVLAFDVRAWDPEARVYSAAGANGNVPVIAGDPGYETVSQIENGGTDPLTQTPVKLTATMPNSAIGVGAFVDLYYNRGIEREDTSSPKRSWTHFSRAPNGFGYGVWDTWPTTYELNTIGNGQALDGLDNNNSNGVDDPSERQTQPPYSSQLRGIQVKIRIYEPQTRQMRQVTVGADFVE